jgi:hypothetical protein
MSLRFLTALIFVSATASANAQTSPAGGVPADPRFWASLSGGVAVFPQLNYLNVSSRESPEKATTIRGSLELDAGKIGGIGIAVATSNVPITWVQSRINDPCIAGCPGDVRVTSILATLHVGGGVGLEQIFQASAGVTMFGDFKGPVVPEDMRKAATDFSAMIGYGVAYGFTPQLSAMVVGDVGLVFHADPGGEGVEADSYSTQLGIRAGLRYGFWSRTR